MLEDIMPINSMDLNCIVLTNEIMKAIARMSVKGEKAFVTILIPNNVKDTMLRSGAGNFFFHCMSKQAKAAPPKNEGIHPRKLCRMKSTVSVLHKNSRR